MADFPSTIPPKKGLSGLAIAGIGCGGLFLVVCAGGFMLAAKACSRFMEVTSDVQKHPITAGARLIVAMNPNLELIKTDEATKEITIKDKQTGQVMTMSLDELQQGKFKVSDDKGNQTTVESSPSSGNGRVVINGPDGKTIIGGSSAETPMPAWVPVYPDGKAKDGGMRIEKEGKVSGIAMVESADAVSKVKDFYDAKFKEAGFKVESSLMNINGTDTGMVNGSKEEGKQKVGAIINSDHGKTSITLTYEGLKQP